MSCKVYLCLLLCLSLCLFAGCGENESDESVPEGEMTEGTEPFIPESYEDHYGIYMNAFKDVTVTLTVETDRVIENRFTLKEEKSGYTITDLTSGKTVVYDEDAIEADILKIAGYLPPYETAYEREGGYGLRLSGDLILDMLLSGSNLFAGYDSECVSLDGECVYTAVVDYGIESYSYEFAVNIDDGGTAFPAKIKYLIEVNE